MEFRSASELLQYANMYLDSLENNPPSSEKEAHKRMHEILGLKKEMERYNFKNPRFAIKDFVIIFQDAVKDMDRSELSEVLSHVKSLRYSFDVRKWTYERARAAYISSRAAYYAFKWGRMKYIVKYLPHGGEYLASVEKYGSTAIAVFNDFIERRFLRDSVSTKVLCSCLLSRAADLHSEEIEKALEEIGGERVKEYEAIVRKYRPEDLATNPEKVFMLLNELEERGFVKDGEIDPEILRALIKRREKKFKMLKKYFEKELSIFLTAYYLLIPSRERKNHPLFPGLPSDPASAEPFVKTGKRALEVLKVMERAGVKPDLEIGAALLAKEFGIEEAEKITDVGREVLKKKMEIVDEIAEGRVSEFLKELGG